MESNTNIPSVKENFWKELVKLVVIAVVVVIPFRLFIAQPFVVDGSSMSHTFENGEYLIVDEVTYHFRGPERGEVIVFKYPKDTSKYFIKRVIGLPNETVNIKNGKISITNKEFPDGFSLEEDYITFKRTDTATYTLGAQEYFVLGDNREGSSDSRYWGNLPEKNVIGRPIFRLWPPIDVWPGEEKYNAPR